MNNPIMVYEASDGSFHKTESELRKHEFKIKLHRLYRKENVTYRLPGLEAVVTIPKADSSKEWAGIEWFIDTFWDDIQK